MVGEGAIELGVQLLELERQPVEDAGDDQTAHAVAGVGHDLQGPESAGVDERANVRRVLVEEVELGGRARLRCGWRSAIGDHALDFEQPGVLADRTGAGQAQLDAAVLGGIVRRGEHGARRVELPRREVDQIGGRQTQRHHVGAVLADAGDEGGRQALAGLPHVPRHQHPVGAGERRERCAHQTRCVGVELVGDDAADVVRLEDRVQRRHGRSQRSGRPPRLPLI